MTLILRSVRTTLLGGLFFLMPLAMLGILLDKAMSVALKFTKPVGDNLPDELRLGPARVTLLAILLLLAICFLAGLLARTRSAQTAIRRLESSVLSKIPAYEYFKQMTGGLLGADDLAQHPVVLAQFEGGWQMGVQVEGEINGFVTVFIPDAPNPRSGAVFLLPADRVMMAGVALAPALNCLKRFGAGTNALLRGANAEPPAGA